MRKKVKAVALTKNQIENRFTFVAFLSLIILFGVLFYSHSFSFPDSPLWISIEEYGAVYLP